MKREWIDLPVTRVMCAKSPTRQVLPYRLTYPQLLSDLYAAYYDARRGKRNKPYQLRFEENLHNNINSLCDELWNRNYKPLPSDCFIVSDPKKREVFAAHFRDRIVHHLYYNYVHEMFERTFIADTYSCINGRGTHYGIRRLYGHIRKESHNYTRSCFVLKMDIRGYFMNINRHKLLDISLASLSKMATHKIRAYRKEMWADRVDMDFVNYLTSEIIMLNPIVNSRFIGNPGDYDGLPHDKSLYYSPPDCGLPIGNLTSQLFSNVYLNVFDQFMKREMNCLHYGRYVDDFYVVSHNRDWLESLIPKIKSFLSENLSLQIHDGKTTIIPIKKGVEYLGCFVLPYRIYSSRATLGRIDAKLTKMENGEYEGNVARALNSYCGILSHGDNYNVRRFMLRSKHDFGQYGCFDLETRHFFD